jgi:hypothetical protein
MALPHEAVLQAFGYYPYREQLDALKNSGVPVAKACDLVTDLTRERHAAEANLAAAIHLARAGVEPVQIRTAVSLCRVILDREGIAPGWAATPKQMTDTAEVVAAIIGLTGQIESVVTIVRYVVRWKETV